MKVKDGKPEHVFTEAEVQEMERLALAQSMRDYLLLIGMGRRGWRVGSIVGMEKKVSYLVKKTGERVTRSYSLPGIRKEDVQADGVVIHSKGGKVKLHRLPPQYLRLFQEHAATLKPGERLIPLSEAGANDIVVKYARAAGLADPERVHNHRLRAFFGTRASRKFGGNIWKVASLMDHKDYRSSQPYIEGLSPEEETEAVLALDPSPEPSKSLPSAEFNVLRVDRVERDPVAPSEPEPPRGKYGVPRGRPDKYGTPSR